MKTLSVSVERNFHIMNDDRFIMEKISQTIQLDDMDDVQRAMDVARLEITNNFKAAYPKVYTHLNFDEVIDYRNGVRNVPNNPVPNDVKIIEHENYTQFISQSDEKINKGTIEEQIRAYTDAEQLKKDWEVTVKGSKKYKVVYDEKIKELNNAISQKDLKELVQKINQ